MQPNRIAQTLARACVVIALCSFEQGHPVTSAQVATGNPPAAVDQQWWRIANAESGNTHPQRGTHSADAVQSIHVNLTDGVVAGMVTSLSPVTLRLRRNGVAISSNEGSPYFDGTGYRYAIIQSNGQCSGIYSPACNAFRIGDTIEVFQNGIAQTVTVPTLTVNANATSNVVSGGTTPTRTVEVYAISSSATGDVFTRTAISAADGTFQTDFTGLVDLAANDSGFAVVRFSANSSFSARYVLPFLRVFLSNNWLYGRIAPASVVTIESSRSTASLGGYQFGDALGRFGQFIYGVQAGDTLTVKFGDQIKQLTAQSITANLDAAHRVTGQTAPGQAVRIRRFARTGNQDLLYGRDTLLNEESVTSDAGGRFTSTLTIDISHAGLASVADPDGDESAALIANPILTIRLGPLPNYWNPRLPSVIVVRDGAPNTVVTMTLRGPSRYAKNTWKSISDFTGSAYNYDTAPLQPLISANDIVEVAQPNQVISITAPIFTSTRDIQANRISGIASPNAEVSLDVLAQQQLSNVAGVEQVYSFHTRADPAGTYQFDLNERVSPNAYKQAIVAMQLGAGHEVYRYVDVSDASASCSASIDEVEVRGTLVQLSSTCQESEVRLNITAPNGTAKFSSIVNLYPYGPTRIDLLYFRASSIQILPGDRIELVGASTVTALVPNMSATIEASGTLRGQALAGAGLFVSIVKPLSVNSIYPASQGIVITGTADSSGGFVIPISPAGAGTQAIVRTQTSSKPIWTVRASLRQIVLAGQDAPYDQVGLALLQPREPFTASITGNTIQFVEPFGQYSGNNEGLARLHFVDAVKPGQTLQVIAGGQIMSITMPALTADYNEIARRVSGTAPAGMRIELRAASIFFPAVNTLVTTADSNGRYSFELAPNMTLSLPFSHVAYVGPGGHEARVGLASMLSFAVTLDDRCVVLLVDNRSRATNMGIYTMTVTSAGGTVKAVGAVTAFMSDAGVCATEPIISGDRVTLQATTGEARTAVLPVMTASYNHVNHVLTGRTVARKSLALALRNSFDSMIGLRTVDANADGSYGIDLSDFALPAAPQTVISLIDDSGNLIMRRVPIINNPRWLPIAFRNPASDGANPTAVPVPIPTWTPGPFPMPTFVPTAVP